MYRRLLVILAVEAMSARALTGTGARSDSEPATLVLARQYVDRHRATLPDLPALILGAGADKACDRDTSYREIISAVRDEAAAAEPAFREDMAMILAEGLTETELRTALARGDLRGMLDRSPRGVAVAEHLSQLVLRRCAEIGERAERRLQHR